MQGAGPVPGDAGVRDADPPRPGELQRERPRQRKRPGDRLRLQCVRSASFSVGLGLAPAAERRHRGFGEIATEVLI